MVSYKLNSPWSSEFHSTCPLRVHGGPIVTRHLTKTDHMHTEKIYPHSSELGPCVWEVCVK